MGRIPSMRIAFAWLLFPGDKSLFDDVVSTEAGSVVVIVVVVVVVVVASDDGSDAGTVAAVLGRKCSATGDMCGD